MMRRRYAVCFFMVGFVFTLLCGCATTRTGNSQKEEKADSNVIYGKVTETGDGSITIEVGERKDGAGGNGGEGQPPSGKTQDGSDSSTAQDGSQNAPPEKSGGGNQGALPEKPDGDNQGTPPMTGENPGTPPEKPEGAAQGERPSMLDLTGETKTIPVTDDTVIKQQARPAEPGQVTDGSQSTTQSETMEETTEKTTEETTEETTKETTEAGQETMQLSHIAVGSMVAITLDDDGNAVEIRVLQGADMEPQETGTTEEKV